MFKKLKDKIAEESQTKLQQLAQAAGYNIPSSDVSNTDSFFSITDETPQNSPHHKPMSSTPNYNNGAAPHTNIVRTRRLSNSSQASDVSFKLPAYDSELPAVYHLQSDMESASELDEAGSVAAMGGQLDLVSKEQLHGAYKKALDRYQKYRGMYTDLARKYRELERDNTKARAVLVETQDKALRRISELREQCSLEQQAKAHLEAALRLEMDEMQCVVKTLTTKLELMGVNAETELNNEKNVDNLIQLNNDTVSHASSSEFSSPLSSQSVDLDKKIHELELQIKQLKEIGMEKDAKIIIMSDETHKLREEYENLKAKTENNSIQLAENKMVVHSELESKEKEMAQLKTKLENTETEKISLIKDNEILNEQLGNLKKQLLESKTINQANKEMLSSQMAELEVALKGSCNEKHQLELKFVEVEKELYDAKTEKTTLAESLSKIKEEKTKIEEQLTTFKMQFSQLQQELKDSLAKNDSLVTRTTEIYQDTFHEKFDGNPESLKKIRELLKEMRTNIETLSKENQTILEDKSKIEQRFTHLFEEKQKVNLLLKETQEKLDKTNEEIENLRIQSSATISNEDKLINLQEKYDEKVKDLETKLNEKEKQIQAMTEKLKTFDDEKLSHLEEIKTLEIKIQELELGFRTSEEKYVTELEPINNELARLRQELVDKTLEMEKLQEEFKRLTREMEKEQRENAKIIEAMNVREKQMEKLQLNLEQTTKRKDELASEFETAGQKRTELQSKVDELLQKNEKLSKEYIEFENEKLNMLTQLQNALEKNSKFELKLLENQKKNESLLKELNEQKNEKHVKSSELEKVMILVTELQLRVQDTLQQNENLTTELNAQKNEKQNQSAQLESALKHVSQLEAKVQDALQLNESLEKQISEEHNEKQDKCSEITTLKGKVELLRKEKNDLEKTLEKEIREKAELKTQVVNILKEITRLEEQLNEVKTSHSNIQSEKEQLEQKFEAFNEKSLRENESTKKLQKEFIEMQKQLHENLAEKEVLISKVQQLEHNLEIVPSNQSMTLDTEDQLTNLRLQLTEILAENAKLSNEKELLEHQVRSLLDNIEVKEKEKLTVLDTNQSLLDSINNHKTQVVQLKENLSSLEEQKCALTETCDSLMEKVDALKKENISLRAEREQFQQRLEEIQSQLEEANNKHSIRENKIRMLNEENKGFKNDIEGSMTMITELKGKLEELKTENKDLRNTIEDYQVNVKSYKEKPEEIQEEQFEQLKREINELKSANKNLSKNQEDKKELDSVTEERNSLKAKLEEIMKEIVGINNNANDLATRNLFLEQKVENYLILEQSNERLKNQVEKLSRQLDETLVSLHHNEGLAANTEFEYLRNILFQYLSGSAGVNGKTLVKVIAAVLKFTPQQTQVVVEKEAHRHSLVGQINNLL